MLLHEEQHRSDEEREPAVAGPVGLFCELDERGDDVRVSPRAKDTVDGTMMIGVGLDQLGNACVEDGEERQLRDGGEQRVDGFGCPRLG